MVEWRIKHIIDFKEKIYEKNYCFFGFYLEGGSHLLLEHGKHWIGNLTKDGRFLWTAGSFNPQLCENHLFFDLKNPTFVSRCLRTNLLLVVSSGTNKIYQLNEDPFSAEVFIDTGNLGLKDVGNSVLDKKGDLWVNEITGCRVWCFDSEGQIKTVLGSSKPGFQTENVSFDDVLFNWIYDIRLGSDGNIYVLDSKNFAVRMIDLNKDSVSLIVGNGKPGYSGDGGEPKNATLGSNVNEQFDGPWSLSLDEVGNIFIGDTQNHVVRMVDRKKNLIFTIAGKHNIQQQHQNSLNETDPLNLNLYKICSLDYFDGDLFIPEWDGELIVLTKNRH